MGWDESHTCSNRNHPWRERAEDHAVDFGLGQRARDLSPDALSSAVARDGTATLVYFESPRSYAPRSAGAVRTLPTTTESRTQLLASYTTETLAHERNAWVYRILPRKAGT